MKVSGVAVTLSTEAAATLNSIFNVTAFSRGFPIGVATVHAILESSRGKYSEDREED